jgi:hypothetical protein
LVDGHVDTPAGSEAGYVTRPASDVVAAAAKGAEYHVRCHCRCQCPSRCSGARGGMGMQRQTLGANPRARVAGDTSAFRTKNGSRHGGEDWDGGGAGRGSTGAGRGSTGAGRGSTGAGRGSTGAGRGRTGARTLPRARRSGHRGGSHPRQKMGERRREGYATVGGRVKSMRVRLTRCGDRK